MFADPAAIAVDEARERVRQGRVGLAHQPGPGCPARCSMALVDDLRVGAGVGRIVGVARVIGLDRVGASPQQRGARGWSRLPPESVDGRAQGVPSTRNCTVPWGVGPPPLTRTVKLTDWP